MVNQQTNSEIKRLVAAEEADDAKAGAIVIVETALQAIPGLGNIATAILSFRNKRDLSRLKGLIEEVAAELRRLKIPTLDSHSPEALNSILERWSTAAQTEIREEKRRYLKNYLVHTFDDPVTDDNFDERSSFLRALADMSALECRVLARIVDAPRPLDTAKLDLDADSSAVVGALHRLGSLGFASVSMEGEVVWDPIVQIHSANASAEVTEYGRRFCAFCVKQ